MVLCSRPSLYLGLFSLSAKRTSLVPKLTSPTLWCVMLIRPKIARLSHIMNSLSQFLSIVYQSIVHSLNTIATAVCTSLPLVIEMADLPSHCTRPDHHHGLFTSNQKPRAHKHDRSGHHHGPSTSDDNFNPRDFSNYSAIHGTLKGKDQQSHHGSSIHTERPHSNPFRTPSASHDTLGSSDHYQPEPETDCTHQTLSSLRLTSEPSLNNPTTYLCTFCWRPHHQSVTPSRVVGRRARISCEPCYNALLDLAVC